LLKSTLDPLTAGALPTSLFGMSKQAEQFMRLTFLARVNNPNFRQALIWR